jgi:sec-independent protein translocase protein TatC
MNKNLKKSNFIIYLTEIRKRLLYFLFFFVVAFILCYFFSAQIYQILLKPLIDSYGNLSNKRIIYTNPSEAFLTYLKLSFLGGLFLSLPFGFLQFYRFLSPALYRKEKKFALIFLITVPLLFFIGAIVAYKFIFPLCFKFFLAFESINNSGLNIEMEAKISEYFGLFMHLIFGFGIAFQLPLLLLFLINKKVITIDFLERKRKYLIVAIFIISAILTPPDIVTQLIMSLPMIIVFEIIIYFLKKAK